MPEIGVTALRLELALQDADRYMAEGVYEEHGLVFATAHGTPLDGSHTFAWLMSESGVTLEEIARLVGHGSTATTEQVYRMSFARLSRTPTATFPRRLRDQRTYAAIARAQSRASVWLVSISMS